jgi:hypothetical protein
MCEASVWLRAVRMAAQGWASSVTRKTPMPRFFQWGIVFAGAAPLRRRPRRRRPFHGHAGLRGCLPVSAARVRGCARAGAFIYDTTPFSLTRPRSSPSPSSLPPHQPNLGGATALESTSRTDGGPPASPGPPGASGTGMLRRMGWAAISPLTRPSPLSSHTAHTPHTPPHTPQASASPARPTTSTSLRFGPASGRRSCRRASRRRRALRTRPPPSETWSSSR